ncbi:glycosyltransferase family 4 protein [Thioclava sp. BHET1]|nr:glycosyltransferase family 4 protein [Thioclava sp. BHET1]
MFVKPIDRLRVLILVENLPVPLDRRVWLEARTLKAAGYAVQVICPMGCGWDLAYEVRDGIPIHRYPAPAEARVGLAAYGREYLSALWHMARITRQIWSRDGFDVIHGCSPPDLLHLIAAPYRRHGVRYLFDHHDVSPELYEAKFARRGWPWHLLRRIERSSFRNADVVIAPNDSFAALARGRGGMAAGQVFTVRSGPELSQFRPGAGDRALRQGASVVLGYLGVIGQQEGMDLLVAAVAHLIGGLGYRDLHVVVIGFGPELARVRSDIHARGLTAHFTFTGALFGADLIAALNACDIGLSPDPRNAMTDISTMNKVLEYMALAKPVVQFDLIEGRASAAEAALYATPNDPVDFAVQIARLIADPARAMAMGRIGRRRIEECLGWAHSAPTLLAAYERILAPL